MKLLIKNANVITPWEVLKEHSVLIENDKIKKIEENDNLDENCCNKVIDAKGNYLSPGFIDIHNHGNFGYDTMDASFEALDSMANFHLKNGVTGFLATTMTDSYEKIERALKNTANYIDVQNREKGSSQVLGIYLEGPYFSEEKKGAQPLEYIKNPNINELGNFIDASRGHIKIVSIAPELEGSFEIISYLKSNNINIAVGHTNSTFSKAKEAIDKGVTITTHLFNGMRGFSHREPGILGAVLIDDRVLCEIICDGIHLHTAAIKLAVKMKGTKGIILISDAMRAAGLEDGEYTLGGQKVFVKNNEAKLFDGTLAGSTLTLNKAVYNMVHKLNLPLKDAVVMASLNPAKAVGLSDQKGSIEIGKDGDLIIFDEKINVSTAIVNGKILYLKD
ncbi:N-acetylglucosamine-6-phosphate deacetylase [Maledivibacter halophilus]|uniref:N-acetylglucosamine-6-phosphate deacetylase n=1 Tax=Maledivibacter halophilus TaxID=36842 RepID=A0A1T5MC60_9FIRM|nr:N-acetylglucosamine-6-phosphate deacetylase [Maledivibacter halophilus]SKC85782.1 N-acetylglucosamine-6-phosphate deacetylase [Maledivibacter halophilus]